MVQRAQDTPRNPRWNRRGRACGKQEAAALAPHLASGPPKGARGLSFLGNAGKRPHTQQHATHNGRSSAAAGQGSWQPQAASTQQAGASSRHGWGTRNPLSFLRGHSETFSKYKT